MKFLIIGMLLVGSQVYGKGPLSNVSKEILSEERLKAATDFETEVELDCSAGTFSVNQCADLRSFIRTQRYNAKLKQYSYFEKLADNRALSRQREIDCVERNRKYFAKKKYPFSQNDDCDAFAAALLVHEPPLP